jgi:hypothetical protein
VHCIAVQLVECVSIGFCWGLRWGCSFLCGDSRNSRVNFGGEIGGVYEGTHLNIFILVLNVFS